MSRQWVDLSTYSIIDVYTSISNNTQWHTPTHTVTAWRTHYCCYDRWLPVEALSLAIMASARNCLAAVFLRTEMQQRKGAVFSALISPLKVMTSLWPIRTLELGSRLSVIPCFSLCIALPHTVHTHSASSSPLHPPSWAISPFSSSSSFSF